VFLPSAMTSLWRPGATAALVAVVSLLPATGSRAQPLTAATGVSAKALNGKYATKAFTLARGQSAVVSKYLWIQSRSRIEIDGTIALKPGAWLELDGNPVLIRGRIDTTTQRPGDRRVLLDLFSPGRITVGNSAVVSLGHGACADLFGYRGVSIAGTVSLSGATHTQVADGPASGDAPCGLLDIHSGCSQNQCKTKPVPGSIRVSGVLSIGGGEDGKSDSRGIPAGQANPCAGGNATQSFAGQDGTDGAEVRYDAGLPTDVNLTGARVIVGRGGNGGDVGDPATGEPAKAPDGATGQGGVNLDATPGQGGMGSQEILFFRQKKTGQLTEKALRSGADGSNGRVLAAAGNGSPGCAGGSTSIHVTAQGPVFTKAIPSTGAITLGGGGNGGSAGDNQHPGGPGGKVTISIHEEGPTRIGAIRFSHYANGGSGYGACTASTVTQGSNGGNGGALAVTATSSSGQVVPPPYTASSSFGGGAGGDGMIPGQGGLAGLDTASQRAGVNGSSGATCPGALTASLSYPSAGIAGNLQFFHGAYTASNGQPFTQSGVCDQSPGGDFQGRGIPLCGLVEPQCGACHHLPGLGIMHGSWAVDMLGAEGALTDTLGVWKSSSADFRLLAPDGHSSGPLVPGPEYLDTVGNWGQAVPFMLLGSKSSYMFDWLTFEPVSAGQYQIQWNDGAGSGWVTLATLTLSPINHMAALDRRAIRSTGRGFHAG